MSFFLRFCRAFNRSLHGFRGLYALFCGVLYWLWGLAYAVELLRSAVLESTLVA